MRLLRWAGIYLLSLSTVILVRIGLWTMRYQRIRAGLVRPCADDPQPARKPTVARITHAVSRVATLVPDASCLTQCIAAQAMLSWKGIPSTITMGLKKEGDTAVKAHAWLSWNGLVVMEGDEGTLSEFTKIHDLPTPTAPSLSA